MALANAGTSYGESDDELTAIFDEKFEDFPTIDADHNYTLTCFQTGHCTDGRWSLDGCPI